jgi:hypothetical protein
MPASTAALCWNSGMLPSNLACTTCCGAWCVQVPGSFPSDAVVEAYSAPRVDPNKARFTFGRVNLDQLRQFCRHVCSSPVRQLPSRQLPLPLPLHATAPPKPPRPLLWVLSTTQPTRMQAAAGRDSSPLGARPLC